ncbi:unnamed protein product [Linum tenue]|uniref:ATP-dependent DNA helicase n=1 Tax=Linum tenue TaxID=586396 RepID=A0AAV0PCA4_9ROSI|nr:unnamed protein product [Linum tenue]
MNVPFAGEHYTPFGGKIVLLGGDFRQTLPIVADAGREESVDASLTRSYLWSFCTILRLSQNMRINTGAPIQSITSEIYADFSNQFHSASYLTERSIVTPTNSNVTEINSHMLALVPGRGQTYFSSDTLHTDATDPARLEAEYPTEFLNNLSFNGCPEHQIDLKVFTPIMLLRNLNPDIGLCNGTRLMVIYLGHYVIRGVIMGGTFDGKTVAIPRIVLNVNDHRWPFVLKRRQFPIRLCYAMTINKSQGQTLHSVGVYLPKPVFSHGQLYVAISRVKSAAGLRFLILNDDKTPFNHTRNIVYSEAFTDL